MIQKLKSNQTTHPTIKLFFCEPVVVIEGEYFDDMTLTDGANFPMLLIKRKKTRVNQRIKFPRDTRRRIQEIAINNGWKTQIVYILREIRDGNYL